MNNERSRSWTWTLNNYTDEEKEELKDLGESGTVRYMVYGFEESASNGTPHVQGFIYFSHAKTFRSVQKLIPRAHLERSAGSPEQNRTYCTKDGNFLEFGECPLSSKAKGEKESERWSRAKEAAMSGELDDIDGDIFIRCYAALKKIKKDYMQKPEDANDVTGVWYYGLAGAGKSRTAREEWPEAYPKMANKWWDGYQGERFVILDDLDKTHKVLGHHLKIWADRYSFLAEDKGGGMHIRPEKFIVTSQYRIEEIWEDEETVAALTRRFTEVLIE